MYHFTLKDPDFLPQLGCDLAFTLEAGSLLVLSGENGIGKTTLLRRLYAMTLTAESVLIPQESLDLFYQRTVLQVRNVFLDACADKISLDEFNFLWNGFGFSSRHERLLSQLSGGELQSLKLVLLLSKKAKIVFLDEPSQFLDQARKTFLQQQISKLTSVNISVLMVEHDLTWCQQGWSVLELAPMQGELRERKKWTI